MGDAQPAAAWEVPAEVNLHDHVLRSTAAAGDHLAIVDLSRGARREWTYARLRAAVAGLAGWLRRNGVTDDDVVVVLTENSAEFVVAYHGILAAGGVVLALDPRDTAEHWRATIDTCGAKALIAETALKPPESALPVVCVGATTPGGTAWEDAVAAEPAQARPSGGDRTAVLMSSSGTEGVPKLVEVTHRNLTSNLGQIDHLHLVHGDDVVLSVPPLRHIYGMQMAMNPSLRAGATLVLGSTPFSAEDFLRDVTSEGVSLSYLVPSVIAELGKTGRPLPSLRMIVSGGAPLPSTDGTRCAQALGVPVVQGFGMTEAGCVSFSPDGVEVPEGSTGVLVPGTEVKFLGSADGTESGELWLRGPQIAPASADADGWLRTGDLVTRDADGFLRITGRAKALIKYKGHQVSPVELEEVVTSHPAVSEAHVAGVPDPVAGEIPKAFVVLEETVSLAEITAYVAERVAPHKRVRAIERVGAIPRSSTGKRVRPPALRVLVTGGGRGLGKTFALALGASGANVVVAGRDEAALAQTVLEIRQAGGTATHVALDVTDEAAVTSGVAQVINECGGLDVVVNNAGTPGPTGPLWAVDEREWRRAVEVNLFGSAAVTRAVAPVLTGRVVNVVSRAGRVGWPNASAYAASKAALISLTASLAGELGETGRVAVAFDPGLVDAGITRAHLDRGPTGVPWEDEILAWTLRAREAGRFTSTEVAADALVAVATGAADHLSGRYVRVEDVKTERVVSR
ncbi:SDR family NAD(P)-dependent oxidoreductase [Amycolatopsis regifaucium]|uniref:AMP-dependent synthetase n=1 Tax=Amycolatopsis regifaucium TaxID=546365 RepID=A0A154MUF7_9PSEU|nr:SDR family NAD(P)-dependent oxidoreductase [Amycolatopsis regifaucium]KZB87984.1 AMP-dependent synthetase [Amycolatopsis regifaucium]OKA04511.1 AMP-dependent synthetase [Amycolatopsis regifaucium]SFH51065.1 Acyl-CoA synthetase (AMP-forming)/AMP-acid ligase II [Amycolatopsis regifaucium]